MKKILTFLACLFSAAMQASVSGAQEKPAEDAYWQTQCSGPTRASEDLSCVANQQIRIAETGQLLFKIDVAFPKGSASFMEIQGPLGFYIPGGLKLSVDETLLQELAVNSCDNRGCFTRFQVDTAMIDAMKRGNVLKIDFAPTVDNRRTIDIPLTGFTKAMTAIQPGL